MANSVPSWSPAVPPPPVSGAVVTTGVRVALGLGLGVAVRGIAGVGMMVGVGDTATVVGDIVTPTEITGVAVTVLPLPAVGGAEPPAVAVKFVAAAVGVAGDEQPDTAANPSMAMAPKPAAVSRARGMPAIAARTVLKYPAGQQRTATAARIGPRTASILRPGNDVINEQDTGREGQPRCATRSGGT